MDTHRKCWNDQQQALQDALSPSGDHQTAILLFLSQHAMVHTESMAQAALWSFADEVLQNMTEDEIRSIPQGSEHSIAWIIWHIARIEDVTMNLLVAETPQLLHRDHWQVQMKATMQHTGNAMDVNAVAQLSAALDIEALLAYRMAVGRRTREIVQALQPQDLKQKVSPVALQRVRDEGAVVEAAAEIIDYWGRRTKAGLLLMPPTRHNFLHLNEALRIKPKVQIKTV